MKLQKPKAIIFDWDNTIVHSWERLGKSINATLAHYEMPTMTLAELKKNIHKSAKDSFPKLFKERSDEARKVLYNFYENVFADIKNLPIDRIEELLKHLKKAGVYSCVVSNKRGDILRNEVKQSGLEQYFSKVVGSLDTLNDKPASDPVILALGGFCNPTEETVWFIGDTPIDVECAINSGCFPILFGDASTEGYEIEEHQYYRIKDFEELINFLISKSN